MRKKILINLLLLVLAIGLGVAVWFTPERIEQQSIQRLTGMTPEQVNHIRIRNNNGPTFVLERQGDGWQMTRPYSIAGNTPRINILLDILATPSLEHFPLPQDRLAEFGLDQPLAEVQFNSTELLFGGTHPYNYRRYVRIGDTIHLTNDNFPHHILARAEAYVSHALLPEQSSIESITAPDWSLHKEAGQWRLTPPTEGISTDDLIRKVEDWEKSWVSSVAAAGNRAETGERIEIGIAGDPQPIIFHVFREEQSLLLIRGDVGLAYRLPHESHLTKRPGSVTEEQ